MLQEKIVIRVDGNSKVGIGHVMRCLAIAEHWKLYYSAEVVFLTKELPVYILDLLEEKGFYAHILSLDKVGSETDGELTREFMEATNSDWLIVDGYEFKSFFYSTFVKVKFKIMIVDDLGISNFYIADLLVNKSLNYKNIDYRGRTTENTKLLLGPDYTPLRQEFIQSKAYRVNPHARKILITFGGSDPVDATSIILNALTLMNLSNLSVKVLVGPSNLKSFSLDEFSRAFNDVEIVYGSSEISEMYIWADLIITAGGTSLTEICYFGVPSISYNIVDNQKSAIIIDKVYGATNFLGNISEFSFDIFQDTFIELINSFSKRKLMSKNGKDLIDGKGNERILEKVKEIH
ncbi:UDP-2,4-diacetamido-2,4,6-trideoxy-beta-L-altropyranose hydrolase [Halobacillus litoralis]|uniref:UDP-2,4-diacetamido-2,4, 6-trideoxy-beta-L-altropyranose hydrolase n=1 Tax=Halobacillus litoralis TaxID=45668 RepID=UPI001CD6AB72|nr:UDP-2,4-diacetamido-2,4,6-trideoxy-beta-L-altropyranose hydrolase [Halobacillus litoralis]MCA0971583.1 UDP-2,4-diacetamido-2,4,6-trideoxy-beta-L-altropyranose hydrolase [Halobacillus litoralis]